MVRPMVQSMLAGLCLGIAWATVATAAEPPLMDAYEPVPAFVVPAAMMM